MRVESKLSARMIAAAALTLALAACGGQKEPAEQALAAVEKAFSESGAEIQKYLPERHAEVASRIEELEGSLAAGEFSDVVAGATEVRETLKRAVAEARIQRAKLLVEMESEWNDLMKTMPSMIDAMDKKIATQRGRPPQGMAADAWRSTIESYDQARDSWSKAASEMSTATFESSVLAAREAKAKIAEIMESVGVQAS